MKRKVLAILLIIMISFLFTGCGKDDKCLVKSSDTAILARGYVMLSPDLSCIINFHGISPSLPSIDSAIVADSLMNLYSHRPSINFHGGIYSARYYNHEDTTRFASGDIVPITIYTPDGKSSCEATALDYDIDSVTLVAGSIPESIPRYGSFTMHWHPSPKADWYMIEFSPGSMCGPYNSEYTVDTFFMVDSQYTASSHVGFTVQPVKGPLPIAMKGNISGGNVIGSVYGTTYGSFGSVTTVDAGKVSSEPWVYPGRKDPFKALDALLDKYQK